MRIVPHEIRRLFRTQWLSVNQLIDDDDFQSMGPGRAAFIAGGMIALIVRKFLSENCSVYVPPRSVLT